MSQKSPRTPVELCILTDTVPAERQYLDHSISICKITKRHTNRQFTMIMNAVLIYWVLKGLTTVRTAPGF